MSTTVNEPDVAEPEQTAAEPDTRETAEQLTIPKKPKRIVRKLVTIIIVLAIIGGTLWFFFLRRQRVVAEIGGTYNDYTVGTRDITLRLSGTGTLNPADSYTVTTLISGEILDAPFEDGDQVEKDSILYRVDSSDVETSLEQAENSLAQSRRNYEQKVKSLDDLNIKANESGTVLELLVETGDTVTNGQTVARIRNSGTMSLAVPFGSDDAELLYVGQSAEVTLDSTFERLTGTITKISPIEERLEGNILVRMVTIDVQNPGGIAVDLAATATAGGVACSGSGTFAYKGESTVTASASGDVAAIYADEGDTVTKNQTIIALSNDTLQNDILNSANSVRDSELSLENREKQLENYTITSPISGQVIEKYYKTGDTLESGKALCTIFDLTYLEMTLNVDELDISQINVGQEVTVTAEALEGRSYTGTVTKVNINGSTSGGVTTYPVTIRIDETDGLLPGMNVQASIIVSQSKDAIAIPVSALARGNRVLVKADGADAQAAPGAGMVGPGAQSGNNQPGEGFTPPEGSINAEDLPQEVRDSTAQGDGPVRTFISGPEAPAGYVYVQVTPGISDGEYIEILSGLNAGDIIAFMETEVDVLGQNGMFMMPAGGMQGSGPPQRQGEVRIVESSGSTATTTTRIGG